MPALVSGDRFCVRRSVPARCGGGGVGSSKIQGLYHLDPHPLTAGAMSRQLIVPCTEWPLSQWFGHRMYLPDRAISICATTKNASDGAGVKAKEPRRSALAD